jgi:hypothetical protein
MGSTHIHNSTHSIIQLSSNTVRTTPIKAWGPQYP